MTLLLIIAAAWFTGGMLIQHSSSDNSFLWGCIRLQLGFCLVGLIGLVIGSFSLAWAQVVLAILVILGMAWEYTHNRDAGVGLKTIKHQKVFFIQGKFSIFCSLVLLLTLIIAFLAALAPSTEINATTYILALAESYAQTGYINLVVGNESATGPHLAQVLYTLALFRGSELMVTLLAWSFGLIVCILCYQLGHWAGGISVAVTGTVFSVTAPVFWFHWNNLSSILFTSGLILSALILLLMNSHKESNKFSNLAIAALFLGSATGVDSNSWIALLLCLPLVIQYSGKLWLKHCSCFLGIAVLAASPWILRNTLLAGEFSLPILHSYFTAYMPDIPQSTEAEPTIRQYLMLPWDLVFRPERWGGTYFVHSVWLLLFGLPACFLVNKKGLVLLAFSIAGAAITWWFTTNPVVLLPYLLPLGPVAAMSLQKMGHVRKVLLPAVILLLAFQPIHQFIVSREALYTVVGKTSRESYLRDQIPNYPLFTQISQVLQSADTILLPLPHTWYVRGKVYADRTMMMELVSLPVAIQHSVLREKNINMVIVPLQKDALADWLSPEIHTMLLNWRHHPELFRQVRLLDFPRPHAPGVNRYALLVLADTPLED